MATIETIYVYNGTVSADTWSWLENIMKVSGTPVVQVILGSYVHKQLKKREPAFFEAHEKRVIEEKVALDEKIAKLSKFTHGPIWNTLEREDQSLLAQQHEAMLWYSKILGDRIERFTATL